MSDDWKSPSKCAHVWRYIGVRFRDGNYPDNPELPNSRYYGQAYLCEKCATVRVDRLKNYDSNVSQPLAFAATPAASEEFPIEDEPGAD